MRTFNTNSDQGASQKLFAYSGTDRFIGDLPSDSGFLHSTLHAPADGYPGISYDFTLDLHQVCATGTPAGENMP